MRTPRIVWARVIWELPEVEIRRLVLLGRCTDIVGLVVLVALGVAFAAMVLCPG
jgi:hypothetical protein